MAACVALCVGVWAPPAAIAARGDVKATGAYLRADDVLTRAVLAHAAASVADMEKEASGVAAECPLALVGAPHGEQLDELGAELTIVVLLSSGEPDKKASLGFAGKVDALHWSNPTIAGLARSVAAEERTAATVTLPDVCIDIKAWTASGYRALPVSTQRFVKATGAIGQETSGGKKESLEELLMRRLQPYEDPSDRQLAKHLKRFDESVEKRLGPAYLKALTRAAQALNPKSS